MLFLLQNVVFAAAFLTVSFLLGFSFLSVIGWKKTTIGSVAWGFIALTTAFHVVAYPLYLLKTSFSLLYVVFSVVLILMLVSSVFVAVRGKIWKTVSDDLRKCWSGVRESPLAALVLCGMMILFIYFCYFYRNSTSDDSYYLPRAMEVLAQNRLDISHSFAWYGREVPVYNNNVDASTFDFFRSYLTRLTGIQVTLLSHNGMVFALQAVSLAAVWTFADSMNEDKEHSFSRNAYAVIIWIAFMLLTSTSAAFPVWIKRHIWAGKAMLPGVIFPMTFASCITLFKRIETAKKREWLSMATVLVSGISVSIVGVFLPPILYFLLVLSYLIVDRFRSFRRVLPGAALSVAPAAVYVAITLWQIVTTQSTYFTRFGDVESWTERFNITVSKTFLIIFLICAVYIVRRGSKLEKAVFVVMPAVLMAVFANPLFMDFVATYVTTSAVYHRLFWLLPMYFAPSLAIPDYFLRKMTPKQVERCLATACFSVALLFGAHSDTSVDRAIAFTRFRQLNNVGNALENDYGIYEYSEKIPEAILADWKGEGRPLLLYYNEETQANEFRLYSCDIALSCLMRPEQLAYQTDPIPGTDIGECDFYATYNEITDGAYLHDMATRLGIDYICFVEEPQCPNMEECGFTLLYRDEKTLWRVEP